MANRAAEVVLTDFLAAGNTRLEFGHSPSGLYGDCPFATYILAIVKESYRHAGSLSPSLVEREIREHLEPGESLIWAGKPKLGFALRAGDLYVIPFSLVWTGFTLFWFATTILDSAVRMPVPLFGVPLVLSGFYMVIRRFWVDAWMRKNTFYGLTDRRAVIVSGLFSKTIKSVPLSDLKDVTLSSQRDASGTVFFGRPPVVGALYRGLHWPGTKRFRTPAFELIEGAKLVRDQVLGAKRALEASN